MKKYIVNFDLFESAMQFIGDADVRTYLNGVRLVKNRIEATNGHIAYMARTEIDDDISSGYPDCSQYYDDVIIRPLNKLPSKNGKNWIRHCVITIDEVSRIDYIDGFGKIKQSDLIEIIDRKLPNPVKLAKLFAYHKKQEFVSERFAVNANYIAIFSKIMKRESFPVVEFHPKASDKSILVSIKRLSTYPAKEMALIMPARL